MDFSHWLAEEYKAWRVTFNLHTGHMIKGGTIMDATIINAPNSTKNAEIVRDPEMHLTKKGNERKFGIKCRFGADSGSGAEDDIFLSIENPEIICYTVC